MSIVHNLANPELVPLGGGDSQARTSFPGTRLSKIVGLDRPRDDERDAHLLSRRLAAPRCARKSAAASVDWGCMLKPEEFIVTNGATEALYLSLQAGDKARRLRARRVPDLLRPAQHPQSTRPQGAHRAKFSPREGAESRCRPARRSRSLPPIAIIPSFSNPLGSLDAGVKPPGTPRHRREA